MRRKPELKQEYDLTPKDFECHPLWVGVHNYDSEEPWYEQSDEETFRPWHGPVPFAEKRGYVLMAATFELADGSVYPGYFCSTAEDWAQHPEPGSSQDAPTHSCQTRSRRYGETPLLLLQCPQIFIDGRTFDFLLRVPELRNGAIETFYAAIQKPPSDVFPVRFTANGRFATGIISGRLDGFYEFDNNEDTLRTDTGEAALAFSGSKRPNVRGDLPTVETPDSEKKDAGSQDVPERTHNLSLADLQRYPVWVRHPFRDEKAPWYDPFGFTPWKGPVPMDPATTSIRIRAIFTLSDGTAYAGYIRPLPENWADIVPPTVLNIPAKSPRQRFGDSPIAIVEQQLPCVFIKKKKFGFWGGWGEADKLTRSFYRALRKDPAAIFPIRFEGVPGLSTGIVSGEVNGFYLLVPGAPIELAR